MRKPAYLEPAGCCSRSCPAAGDHWSVACRPPQGRFPNAELHLMPCWARAGLGWHTSAASHQLAAGAHYLQHKSHSPAVFSSPRALGSKLMTPGFITSNPPLLSGQAPRWPGSSYCLCAKGKGEREACCASRMQSQEQGHAGREESCPRATCS